MIITFTENTKGQGRIYLGGKGSLECWIEPKADGKSWTFHIEPAVAGVRLSETDKCAWALYTLQSLASELGVEPPALAAVPFGNIAALHTVDPYLERRVPSPKRRVIENGYTAVSPPTSLEFNARSSAASRQGRLGPASR